jgi:hypothetical protein
MAPAPARWLVRSTPWILSHPDTLKFNYVAADPLWLLITDMEAAVTNANVGTALGSIMSPESFRRMRTEGVYGPGLGRLDLG